jgi:hypothetical protein
MYVGAMTIFAVGVVLAWDIWTYGTLPINAKLGLMGLPHVGLIAAPEADHTAQQKQEFTEAIRALSMKLRKHMTAAGDVLMVSTVGSEDERMCPAMVQLALCYANQDENVVILDCREENRWRRQLVSIVDLSLVPQTVPPDPLVKKRKLVGLADFLQGEVEFIDDIAHMTNWAGVDAIVPGRSRKIELAKGRMTELVDELKKRYTFIIMLAPSPQNRVDFEILSSHAQGIVFTYSAKSKNNSTLKDVVKAQDDLNRPIIGSLRTDDPRNSLFS